MLKKLKICLINPKFEPSFWGLDFALPLYPGNKKCAMTTGSLAHLAGLVPDHDVYLMDENVEEIDFNSLRGYDIVGVTGMIVQKDREKAILLRLKEMGIFTIVGGAYASVNESFFDGLCDVLFSGEADETWPEFVNDFAAGREYKKYYKQDHWTDLTTLRKPRFELLKGELYGTATIQFSRGCPFQCEFCDIIVTFGRQPRNKNPEQIIDELEDLRKLGYQNCFLVDDNFICDKKSAKALLHLIIPWMQEHGYPLRLFTQASLNVADDPELLDLMYQANFRSVFIGIESPRIASLQDIKKFQNAARGSMSEKIDRIRNAGMELHCGFIIGFDHDDISIIEEQYRFIQDNGILQSMVGMLVAIPRTPLYKRFEKEGRLRPDDINNNFVPKLMTLEEMRQGFWDLLTRLYSPGAFFDRHYMAERFPDFNRKRAEMCSRAGEGKTLPTLSYGLIMLWKLIRALSRDGSLRSMGRIYLHYFFAGSIGYRSKAVNFAQYMNRCALHWHFYKFIREGKAGRLRIFNST